MHMWGHIVAELKHFEHMVEFCIFYGRVWSHVHCDKHFIVLVIILAWSQSAVRGYLNAVGRKTCFPQTYRTSGMSACMWFGQRRALPAIWGVAWPKWFPNQIGEISWYAMQPSTVSFWILPLGMLKSEMCISAHWLIVVTVCKKLLIPALFA